MGKKIKLENIITNAVIAALLIYIVNCAVYGLLGRQLLLLNLGLRESDIIYEHTAYGEFSNADAQKNALIIARKENEVYFVFTRPKNVSLTGKITKYFIDGVYCFNLDDSSLNPVKQNFEAGRKTVYLISEDVNGLVLATEFRRAEMWPARVMSHYVYCGLTFVGALLDTDIEYELDYPLNTGDNARIFAFVTELAPQGPVEYLW